MCLKHAVGEHCPNKHIDVKIVQVLLNLNLYQLLPLAPLAVDLKYSKALHNAILLFQSRVMKMPKPDGRVDPHGKTFKQLRAGILGDMCEMKMKGIFIHAEQKNVAKFYPWLVSKMAAAQINTPLRMAHFLAQIGTESYDFLWTSEQASGEEYEDREDLGNTQPGDGKRFKGRGLIQLTGRANYVAYGKDRNTDYTVLDRWTQIATDPEKAVDVAVWYWDRHDLNTLADHGSVEDITRVINGGLNGIDDRKSRFAMAKCFLMSA